MTGKYQCPNCGSVEIVVYVDAVTSLDYDGKGAPIVIEIDWTDKNACRCSACDWEGEFRQLTGRTPE